MPGTPQGSLESCGYEAEDVFATANVAPAMLELRHNENTLHPVATEITSKESHNDALVRDSRMGPFHGEGNIDVELCYGVHSDFLAASVRSAGFPGSLFADIVGTTIAVAATDQSFTATGLFAAAAVGDFVIPSGLVTNAAANGKLFKVLTKTDDKITVVGFVTLVDESAGESFTIAQANTVENGVATPSWIFERANTDLTTPFYRTFLGSILNTMGMNLRPTDLAQFSMGFMAKTCSSAAATVGAATAAATTDAQWALSGYCIAAGAALTAIQSLNFSGTHNLSLTEVLFANSIDDIVHGVFDLTGSFAMYFKERAHYQAFIDRTVYSLLTQIQDPAGNKVIVGLPKINLTSVDAPKGTGPLMATFGFHAVKHSTWGHTISITEQAA